MSNLYYASAYKNKIINLLLKNRDFVKLINPAESECIYLDTIDVLLGGKWVYDGKKYEEQGYVFDYNFVNETTTEEKTFVFVETDIETVDRDMFVDFNLYICVFTPKRFVRITDDTIPSVQEIKNMGYYASTYANRIDVLCDIIDKTINGSQKIPGIGTVSPSSRNYVSIYCPSSKYYGKRLKYHITNLNEIEEDCSD